MTVRELINALLDCDMDATVTLRTTNKDTEGRHHLYELTGIGHAYSDLFEGDFYTPKMRIPLTFRNYDFDKKKEV